MLLDDFGVIDTMCVHHVSDGKKIVGEEDFTDTPVGYFARQLQVPSDLRDLFHRLGVITLL